jgi:hypothetical protein
MMLTPSYMPGRPKSLEPAVLDGCLVEWALRETAYRHAHPEILPEEVALVVAHDAGDVCHVCGNLVTWVDHLPPTEANGPVRCFKNVHLLNVSQDIVVDDIFPRV